MTLYRKKPVEVEAMQFVDRESALDIEKWSGDAAKHFQGDGCIRVLEPTRFRYADPGDWIVKEAGEFYVCKPEIFEATYEKVE